MRAFSVIAVLTMLTTQAVAHSGGLNKQGCHAGSQPYHCHKSAKVAPVASSNSTILSGTVTHVRDGDTIEVNGIAVRLSALDCPENDTQQGKQATKIAKQFEGSQGCCQTNENSHRIACAALIYALNSWRHSVRAAVRLTLKLSRE